VYTIKDSALLEVFAGGLDGHVVLDHVPLLLAAARVDHSLVGALERGPTQRLAALLLQPPLGRLHLLHHLVPAGRTHRRRWRCLGRFYRRGGADVTRHGGRGGVGRVWRGEGIEPAVEVAGGGMVAAHQDPVLGGGTGLPGRRGHGGGIIRRRHFVVVGAPQVGRERGEHAVVGRGVVVEEGSW